mgnify:CR=1 FL=1
MSDVERDVMEYDVVTVGAGPAGLAFAIRLKQLNPDISVCVIEKASTIGAHILSGAVIEPAPLDALLPGWRDNPPPICVPATEDEFWYFSKDGGRKFPIVPPGMRNHGNFIVSLGAMCAWLAPQAEALGVEIYPGFAAVSLTYDDKGAVTGVITGDMGLERDGSPGPGYAPGMALYGKYVLLGLTLTGLTDVLLMSWLFSNRPSYTSPYSPGNYPPSYGGGWNRQSDGSYAGNMTSRTAGSSVNKSSSPVISQPALSPNAQKTAAKAKVLSSPTVSQRSFSGSSSSASSKSSTSAAPKSKPSSFGGFGRSSSSGSSRSGGSFGGGK